MCLRVCVHNYLKDNRKVSVCVSESVCVCLRVCVSESVCVSVSESVCV